MKWKSILHRSHFPVQHEFLEKYKDKTTEDDMIGHFRSWILLCIHGSGRSAYRYSYLIKKALNPVHWVSEGGTEYEMAARQQGQKSVPTITLYLERGQPGVCKRIPCQEKYLRNTVHSCR